MTVQHHPEQDILLAHAAGRLDPAMALLGSTHLHFCGRCRDDVMLGEAMGGALLAGSEPVALAGDALAKVMALLDAPVASIRPLASNDNTPPSLRAFLGRDLSTVRWRSMGPRLGYRTLYRRGGTTLRLLRGAPGSDVGAHTHRGAEYTVVLKGGYRDETGDYGPGDFQMAGGDVMHNPVADPGEDCINLALTTDRLRFRSTAQNLIAKLFGF